jgi:Flp pilus assembly protein TadD
MDLTVSSAPGRIRRFLCPTLIALLVFAIYVPSWSGGFLNYDDDFNLTSNPHYRGFSGENLRWMFTNTYGHYIPLTWLSFALDYTLWGMNPVGYRAMNTLLHALNAILFFFILKELLQRAKPGPGGVRLEAASLAGALFFALHPLRVASVAWITERRDMLSGAFFFLAVLVWLRAPAEPGGRRTRFLALSVGCFALMILSKALGIMLPFVLLVLDVWPLRRFSRSAIPSLLLEKLPFFLLTGVGLVLTSYSQRTADTIYTREQYPLTESLLQPGLRVAFYVWKTILPIRLSPMYLYRPGFGLPQLLGWATVLGLTVASFAARRRMPALAAAWVSYGLLIAPVCGVFQAGPHFANDVWSYLPCTPLAALFAGVLWGLDPARARRAGILAGSLLCALAISSVRQTRVYMDSVALWDAALRLDPDVYYSLYQRGRAKAEKGDDDGAIADLTRSIDLRSGFPDPWYERGRAWMRKNRPDRAREDFTVALHLDPRRAAAAYQLGLSDLRLGLSAEAIVQFSRAIELQPDYPEALVLRGRLLALGGRIPEALADLSTALRLDPQPATYLGRATIRGAAGDLEGAVADCTEAIRRNPVFPEAYVRRGKALLQKGDQEAAAADFGRALDSAPATWPERKDVERLLRSVQKSR